MFFSIIRVKELRHGWCLYFHHPLICSEFLIQKGSLIIYVVGGGKHQPRRGFKIFN